MILDITFEENKSEIDVGLDPTTEYASKLLEKVKADNDETEAVIKKSEAAIKEAAESVVDAAERVEKVSVDKGTVANALKGTASGEVVRVDDVSPIEHTAIARVSGKNLLNTSICTIESQTTNGVTITPNSDGSYTVSGENTTTGFVTFMSKLNVLKSCSILPSGMYSASVGCTVVIQGVLTNEVRNCERTFIADEPFKIKQWYCYVDANNTMGSGAYRKLPYTFYPQLEKGDTASEYEPYIDPTTVTVTRYGADENDNPQTYTPSADGTVEIASLSPTMTLITDTPGVNIDLEYNQDTNKAMDAVHTDLQEVDRVIAELVQKPTVDFSKFNQAYVRNGRLICNDGNASDNETAKYIGADVKYPVSYAEIRFGFTGNDDQASVLLILSKRGNTLKHHITHGSLHIGVTPTNAAIQFFWDNTSVLHTIQSRTFKQPLQPNTEYSLKLEYFVHANQVDTGEYCIKITFPDGTYYTYRPTDTKTFNLGGTNYNAFEIINALNGRYIMFEHFYDNPSTIRGYYTSWLASAPENMAEYIEAYRQRLMYDLDKTKGNQYAIQEYTYTHDMQYLRHDFATCSDGTLLPAQTGQTYTLFSHSVKCESGLDVH